MMNSIGQYIGLLLAVFVFFLVVFFAAPHFIKTETQYKVSEAGIIEETEIVATDSAGITRQSALEKIAGALDNDAGEEFSTDTFANWEVLENFEVGYRLIYPAGFEVNYQFGKVEIEPPDGLGRVVVYIKDGAYEVKVHADGLDEKQASMLKKASKLVESTFEFTSSSGYNTEEVEERFSGQ